MKPISITLLAAALLFLALDAERVAGRTLPEEEAETPTLRKGTEGEAGQAPRTTEDVDPQGPDEAVRFGASPDGTDPEQGERSAGCDSDNPLGCGKDKQASEMDPDEYRRLRIEVIKEKILQKLGLKSPPQVRLQRSSLPSVLLSNSEALLTADHSGAIPSHPARSSSQRLVQQQQPASADDDFYGTTKNVFIFPDNSSASQSQCSQRTSLCLVFRLSPEVFSGNLASSHLWLYKRGQVSATLGSPVISNQTLVVSEVVFDRNYGVTKRILSLEDDELSRSAGGWVRLRVDRAVRRWVTKPHLVHALEVTCKGCGPFPVPVSQQEGHQPFLVLALGPQATLTRRRREVDCTNSSTTCCRESFYLSFTEIGWSEWILQPPGYMANYCRGTCLHDVSNTRYHHTSVLSGYMVNRRALNEEIPFSLCCTPSKMSSISMIYIDEGQNVFQKNLPNMVAEACDCA